MDFNFFPTDSKNVVQLDNKWSRPIIVPEFSPNGDLTLIRFENATRRVKAQKKVRTNQTQADLPTVATPLAEYMTDIMNEIPKNTTKNQREKLIIENLFIEILRDDQLKNQLTDVISNVTKNTISKTNVQISTDGDLLATRSNKTRGNSKIENSSNDKRNKSSNKSETTTTLPVKTTERIRESNDITKVEFNLKKNRGNVKTVSKFEIWDDDEEDEDDNKAETDEANDIRKNKSGKQVDKETEENTTIFKNNIDDDDDVTVETDESESTTVTVETTTTAKKSTTTPTTTTEKPTTRRSTNDKTRNTNRRKQPTKSNLETLDERGIYNKIILFSNVRIHHSFNGYHSDTRHK